jgi:hypothetical protein
MMARSVALSLQKFIMMKHFRLNAAWLKHAFFGFNVLVGLALVGVSPVKAQEYCGYPEVYKLSTVTLDTNNLQTHAVSDVIQNQRGVWTVGFTYDNTLRPKHLLLTRFNDTGKLEWHRQFDVDMAQVSPPRLFSTDDQGVLIIANVLNPVAGTGYYPWIANIGPDGTYRWGRKLEQIPGFSGSANFNNVEVKSNGEIWIVGGVYNGIHTPVCVRLNRFGNVLDARSFIEPVGQTLPFITNFNYFKDIISWGNSMLVAGEYQENLPAGSPSASSRFQPFLTLFDSVGGFVKNIYFKSELPSMNYRVMEIVRSTRHPSRVFMVGSLNLDISGPNSIKNSVWAACIDVLKDSVLWQYTYDTLESQAQRAYFDRDKLMILYRVNRADGIHANGIMQLDSLGNWEFVHHMKVGDENLLNWSYPIVRNSFPLRDGGLVLVGNDATLDTAHLTIAWTKPCDPDFCTNIAYSVKSKKASGMIKRPTKGYSEFSLSTKSFSPNSSQVPALNQTVGCRFCPMPIINVSDVILCDFPLFHQQDVWDIYSKVTWNDGDNAKYKSFDRVGQYWLLKQNACGTVRDTFRISKENRPVKVLNDNEYFCRGRLFTLKGTQPNPGTFFYNWSDGSSGSEKNVFETTTLSLTTSSPGCGSRTDVVNVFQANCDCEICVPNAFTPYNSDSKNDEWLPRTDCKYANCTIKEGSYRIYNRWGEKVAENPINVAWNGTDAKGDFVARGVYIYNIKIIFDESVEGNRIINESGDITVF